MAIKTLETREIAQALLERYASLRLIRATTDILLGQNVIPTADNLNVILETEQTQLREQLNDLEIQVWLIKRFPQAFGQVEVIDPTILDEIASNLHEADIFTVADFS